MHWAQTALLDYRIIIALSCLLSLWLILIDPIINLRTADAYLQGGVVAGQSLFDRPILPIIFALFHKATGIPLLYSGLILTTAFYALLCVSFVATIRVMGGDRRVQIIAVIIILSHPMLNHERSSIMRDPAYWAFSLLAFRELLLFARSPEFKYQLRWLILIAIAILFRFEGLFFLILAPFTLLIAAEKGARWYMCARLAPLALIAIGTLLPLLLFAQSSLALEQSMFPDIGRYVRQFFRMPQDFALLAEKAADNWLSFTSTEDAAFAVIGGLIAILGVNLLRSLTWPYVGVMIWGASNKLFDRIQTRDRRLINSHLIICLVYLSVFLLTKRFMLERYANIFTLYALLYVPFLLNSLWSKGKKGGGKLLVILVLFGFCVDSLTNRDYEKVYIKDATQWLIDNTSEDASLMTNSPYIAYFSRRNFNWGNRAYLFTIADLEAQPEKWRNSNYLTMRVKKRDVEQWQEFLSKNSLRELKVFTGHRTGQVSIVKIPHVLRLSNLRQ
jgi:hypothetical protein